MGRRKVSMGLIPNRRVRVGTFAKRAEGLRKKAKELSVLCGVDVALVVASADADAPPPEPDKWESREGVLARYRALVPEARARHTHRAYLEAELGKGEAKLARVRQGGPDGLGRWDKALDGVDTAEEAQRLLDDVDAAIKAARDRRRALGMPVEEEDDDVGAVLEGVQPLSFASGTAVDDYLMPHANGGDNSSNDHQAAMWSGGNGFHHHQGGDPVAMQHGGYYGFHQYSSCDGGAGMEGYHHLQMALDMYGSSGAYQQMQHGYFGVSSDSQMLLGRGAAAQPNLAMWSGADEPCLAMVPVEYPSTDAGINYADTSAAHGAHQDIGGGPFAMGIGSNFVNSAPALSLGSGSGSGGDRNFINAAPAATSSYAMGGSGDNFTKVMPAQPLAMSYGDDLANVGRYATQWQTQCDGTNQKPSVDELPYLGDLEGTQLHLWGN